MQEIKKFKLPLTIEQIENLRAGDILELTGTIFGLGARIQGAQQFMDTAIVLLGIITIGIIGFVLDKILLLIEKKLTKWK